MSLLTAIKKFFETPQFPDGVDVADVAFSYSRFKKAGYAGTWDQFMTVFRSDLTREQKIERIFADNQKPVKPVEGMAAFFQTPAKSATELYQESVQNQLLMYQMDKQAEEVKKRIDRDPFQMQA